MSTAYEELVERCVTMLAERFGADPEDHAYVLAILSEAFHTLEDITPEMDEAFDYVDKWDDHNDIWLAMLRASPIAPPKEGK